MTKKTFNLTRRTFGTMLGAAAVTTPGLAGAVSATPRDQTILSLDSVPLAWPQYHRLGAFPRPPRAGDTVTLEREARAPFDDRAIRVRSLDGEPLGYIPRRHNAALAWAMERGDVREAQITKIAEPVVRGQRVSGWGSLHVDVHVAAGIA